MKKKTLAFPKGCPNDVFPYFIYNFLVSHFFFLPFFLGLWDKGKK